VRFVHPKGFRKKRIKRHFECMLKVRSRCVRRQSDAKEVTAKPSAWLFVNTVFKRLDSGDAKILNRAYRRKNIAKINPSAKLNIAGG